MRCYLANLVIGVFMHPKYTLCAHLAKFQVLVWVIGPVGIAKMAQNDDLILS